MTHKQPKALPRSPRKSLREWGHFVHLLARFYMNYRKAILTAASKTTGRAVDVDVQISLDKTMWALHWGDIGKNKLHDPAGKLPSSARISNLTDAEVSRLRASNGKKPHTIRDLLRLAEANNVRVELELKTLVPEEVLEELFVVPFVQRMHMRGDLQIKTLAALPGAIHRLKAAHDVGFTTILSFTNYRGDGIDKEHAWPVTDFTRGRVKWS